MKPKKTRHTPIMAISIKEIPVKLSERTFISVGIPCEITFAKSMKNVIKAKSFLFDNIIFFVVILVSLYDSMLFIFIF